MTKATLGVSQLATEDLVEEGGVVVCSGDLSLVAERPRLCVLVPCCSVSWRIGDPPFWRCTGDA